MEISGIIKEIQILKVFRLKPRTNASVFLFSKGSSIIFSCQLE